MKWFWREIVQVALIIVGIFALFFGAVNWRENRVVNKIIVKGNNVIPNEKIIELANVKIGERITDLDLSEIRARVEEHKFVKYADVYTNLPDFLIIEVVERKPIAMVIYNSKIYYVDSDGFVISSDEIKKVFPVPLLGRLNYKPVNLLSDSTGQLKMQFDLLKLAIDKKVDSLISEVRVENGEVIIITTDGAVPVFLGSDGFEKKLIALKKFWERYVIVNGFPRYIDLKYEGKLYANFNSKK
jgi:cell division protein FtsQ